MYEEELFDETQLTVNPDIITYKEIQTKRIVFCNGIQANNSSFFNNLKFNPTKGEVLTIRMNKQIDCILSGNIFLLPLGDNLFHVGATYQRDYKDALPSKEGLLWLTTELEKIIDMSYEIIEHRAGIRPTTFGHRPYIGWHETYNNMGIFSGFGSKGVSTIAYYAQQLIAQ